MKTNDSLLDIKLVNLLEQINQLNERIAFHRKHSSDESMIVQYEEIRGGFVRKMNRVLKQYQLKVVTRLPQTKPKNSGVSNSKKSVSFSAPDTETAPLSPQLQSSLFIHNPIKRQSAAKAKEVK